MSLDVRSPKLLDLIDADAQLEQLGTGCEFTEGPVWHAEGKFPLDRLVSRRYKLDEVFEACDDLEHGRILGRGIIEY